MDTVVGFSIGIGVREIRGHGGRFQYRYWCKRDKGTRGVGFSIGIGVREIKGTRR